MSELVACAEEGERIGELTVPAGYTGFATVCSIVVNGILLKSGIPMDSRFGGILQVKDAKPLRFIEVINYSGSSLDPSEVFIRGRMTSVRQAAVQGEGKILANFREIPVPALKLADGLIGISARRGSGVLAIGEIGEPICQIPVDMNRVGMILYGGLNPVACVHEGGVEVENRAMSTVMEYQEVRNFWELCKRPITATERNITTLTEERGGKKFMAKVNPFATAQKQLDQCAKILHLDPGIQAALRVPSRELHVSLPVRMDDGSVKVFQGFRVQYNDAKGPARAASASIPTRPSTPSAPWPPG